MQFYKVMSCSVTGITIIAGRNKKRIGDKVQIHGVIDKSRGKASTYEIYDTDGQSQFS